MYIQDIYTYLSLHQYSTPRVHTNNSNFSSNLKASFNFPPLLYLLCFSLTVVPSIQNKINLLDLFSLRLSKDKCICDFLGCSQTRLHKNSSTRTSFWLHSWELLFLGYGILGWTIFSPGILRCNSIVFWLPWLLKRKNHCNSNPYSSLYNFFLLTSKCFRLYWGINDK